MEEAKQNATKFTKQIEELTLTANNWTASLKKYKEDINTAAASLNFSELDSVFLTFDDDNNPKLQLQLDDNSSYEMDLKERRNNRQRRIVGCDDLIAIGLEIYDFMKGEIIPAFAEAFGAISDGFNTIGDEIGPVIDVIVNIDDIFNDVVLEDLGGLISDGLEEVGDFFEGAADAVANVYEFLCSRSGGEINLEIEKKAKEKAEMLRANLTNMEEIRNNMVALRENFTLTKENCDRIIKDASVFQLEKFNNMNNVCQLF